MRRVVISVTVATVKVASVRCRQGLAVLAVSAASITSVTATGLQGDATVYRPGKGVTFPRVLREVKPQYSEAARREKIEGTVLIECTVATDGHVIDPKVVKSLDTRYGLDQEAIKAAKQWLFAPGLKDGEPVNVRVRIELTFTLKP